MNAAHVPTAVGGDCADLVARIDQLQTTLGELQQALSASRARQTQPASRSHRGSKARTKVTAGSDAKSVDGGFPLPIAAG